jgi:hypothetical protein
MNDEFTVFGLLNVFSSVLCKRLEHFLKIKLWSIELDANFVMLQIYERKSHSQGRKPHQNEENFSEILLKKNHLPVSLWNIAIQQMFYRRLNTETLKFLNIKAMIL